MNLSRGLLVAVEGIDGAGKTTQARMLARRLREFDFTVIETKEPTAGPWGMKIRASKTRGRLPASEELEAFIEDRKQHVREVIEPGLVSGAVVIVDRYYYSTAAYQGARGVDPETILATNEAFAPRPDLLVLLHINPQLGLQRIKQRGDEADLFEREADLTRSAAIFKDFGGGHVLALNGAEPADEIHRRIVDHLYEGPLFKALCRKSGYKSGCEPAYCSFRIAGACDHVALAGLVPV